MGGVRLLSHSVIRVDAVLLRFPGDSFVKDGQGISSRLLVETTSAFRGGWSIELGLPSALYISPEVHRWEKNQSISEGNEPLFE